MAFFPEKEMESPNYALELDKFSLGTDWASTPARLLGCRVKFLVFRDKGALGLTWQETGVSIKIFERSEERKAGASRLMENLKATGPFSEYLDEKTMLEYVEAALARARDVFIIAAMSEWCDVMEPEEVEKLFKMATVKTMMGR
jgi:hypothetical protein